MTQDGDGTYDAPQLPEEPLVSGSPGAKWQCLLDAAQAEKRRYKELFHLAPDGYIVTDSDGIIREVNRAAELLLNTDMAGLVGTHVVEFVVEEDRQQLYTQIAHLSDQGSPEEWELRIVPRSGEVFPVTIMARAVRGCTADKIDLCWLIHDISRRRCYEEMLRKRTRDLDQRVRELDCLYAVSRLLEDRDTPIEDVLQSVVNLLPPAWEHSDVVCARVIFEDQALGTPGFKETPWCLSSDILVDGEIAGKLAVCYIEEPTGRNVDPFSEDERHILSLFARRLGMFIEQRFACAEGLRIEEHLHQAQKMEAIGELASGVSHDFNNLLTVIRCATERLKCQVAESPSALQGLEVIEEAACQATDVTRALLTFSRKAPGEKQPVDVNRIVKESISLLDRVIPTSVKLNVQLCDDAIWCNGDATQLQRIIFNLTINACDAMPLGGKLWISTEVAEEQTGTGESSSPGKVNRFGRIIVKDNGEGMPPEVRSRVFEPFFTTKQRGQGSGLGLAVVHGIVREHNGRVHLETAVDQGAAFSIVLPLLSEEVMRSAVAATDTPPRGKGEVVLLAEENLHLRGLVAMSLESLGYRVDQVDDIHTLEKRLKALDERPSLLILDVGFIDEYSFHSISELHSKELNARTIILTSDEMPEWCEGLVSHTYSLPKPFRMPELGSLVSTVLHSSAAGGEQS